LFAFSVARRLPVLVRFDSFVQSYHLLSSFLGMMPDLREKTGTASNVSLLEWAQRHLKSGDQRVDRHEQDYAR